jgi:hypothetical protein
MMRLALLNLLIIAIILVLGVVLVAKQIVEALLG